ncbi:MAG: 2-amino-4-hydroxy-6-hydroxymethyldihydropteridine diphosphokinase [Eubacterium sp.]|nr:2-amino-4-hydroxy-6-hydroxymethyldihydropteridine diphosphokinase [Eubacterium sp.]
MDKIQIKDIECFSNHGVLKEENVLGQKFLVTADLYVNTRKAGTSDSLEDSVDYAEVAHYINEIMGQRTCKLIESVAEIIATKILIRYKSLLGIKITIKKPWAPIMLPLETVSLSVERMWKKVYVSVGSNIGHREEHIQNAYNTIRNNEKCKNAYMSRIIETEPYGYTEQDDFLNGVICFETIYDPRELLDFLQDVEKQGGRTREIHWGPRTIDLDIIYYDDLIIQEEDLIIPHREAHIRDFVLRPMCDVAPFFKHPVFGKTMTELLEELEDKR